METRKANRRIQVLVGTVFIAFTLSMALLAFAFLYLVGLPLAVLLLPGPLMLVYLTWFFFHYFILDRD